MTALLSYALLAALFAFIWPYKALQWAAWLCLPAGLLICFDLVATGNLVGVLFRSGMTFVKTVAFTCLGAYAGSKFSPQEIAAHSVKLKRLKNRSNGVQGALELKKLAAASASVKALSLGQSTKDSLPSLETMAHLNNLNVALLNAVQVGELERVRLLVAQGADINAQSSNQWIPFVHAGRGFDVAGIETIFGKGAATVVSNGKGWTPLTVATVAGRAELVRELLAHGAEVNAENCEGWTALRFAVSMDESEILHLLLDAGANPNLIDQEGQTALMQAARENSTESLKALLEAGADPRIEDHNQQTALKIAQEHDHTESISLLEEFEDNRSGKIEAPVRKARLTPARLLALAAIFHLALTVTIVLLGRYAIFPNTFDRNGVGVSFAADVVQQYHGQVDVLSEALKRGEIRTWLSYDYQLHVKLYSISYTLFSFLFDQSILSIEPLNLFYYLAILVLVFHIGSEIFDRRAGLLAAATVGLWPSFLLHTTQLLRDPLFIAGMLALVLVLLRLAYARNYAWPKALLVGGSGGLVFALLWFARNNMGEILIAVVAMGALMLIARQFAIKRVQIANLLGMAVMIVIAVGAQQVIPKSNQRSQDAPLSGSVESKLGNARRGFITKYADAGSNIDTDTQLTSTSDIIRYLPRAAMIGFFAPFPNMWFTPGKQVGSAGRMLSGMESLVIYIVEAFAIFALWQRRRQLSAWFLFLTAAMGMIALGLVVTNIGALFRMRYLFLFLLIILAAGGAWYLLEKAAGNKRVMIQNP